MATYTLIVMSDSHGNKAVVQSIKDYYQGKVDAIFHNGDSELPSNLPLWEGIQVVGGNCDGGDYPERLVTDFEGLRVAQTHGHHHLINLFWDRLNLWAQEERADICLYGHLHQASAWQEGQIVFVNPGSVEQPRGEVREKLYAKIEVTGDKIKVDFFDLNHQLYPSLSKEFQR
ncbi:metallophosphoesterase [Streptococcus sp. sy010]|uniref:metallophosphoesterase n=1 Tax=Streptococcus sp. sy010 TaxID=2600148 RepID=UPI0011B5E6ED|nr:metallophosphoesterase [Streptococcus sp. sy010]TWT16235.1 metallophosphoesterase [Streptococcus sp. sy010]